MRKKIILIGAVILYAAFSFISCKSKDNPIDETTTTVPIVSQFVYDGLSQYYLWADQMTSKTPTVSDTDPTAYFKKILSSSDKFSWITDDVEGLLAGFAGEPKDFGFVLYGFAYANDAHTEYYAIINYVFPNTPASKAGIRRLDFIRNINDQPITESNYTLLYGTDPIKLTMYKLTSSGTVAYDKDVTIAPEVINTNPVYCDSIYEVPGHKVGYLFYTDFIANYNDSLYKVFSKFKQAGVTDLVLDLRYNHGGAVTAATYLSSLIAPKSAVENKSPFVKMSYNDYINGVFDYYYNNASDANKSKYDRTDYLGNYDSSGEQNPVDANLNLTKVYIIATGDSYSASELTTFCLKSYMDVVHIGENTGGKYVASWTIHPYNENLGVPVYDSTSISEANKALLKNWAMQPIVAKYTNKDGEDFSSPGYLVPDHSLTEGNGYITNLTQIGDTKDTFLGEALYLITGDEAYKPSYSSSASKIKALSRSKVLNLSNPRDIRKSSVILDNVKSPPSEVVRKILQKR